jgi:phosphoglycerol transferase MdoB-like AlkP superfamily enzyme
MATGYQHITSDDDYSIALQHTGKWGVPDNVTFGTLYDMLSKRSPGKPWHTAFLTLSSHEPWTVPIKRFDYEVYNAFAFLDDCIGNFISKFRKTPQWKNTLIVILPDHGIKHPNLNETDLLRNHIPMIWTGGAVKAHRCINVLANQTDLAATLLGQLGIRHDEFTFSRDVTSKTYTNQFAYHTYNNGFSMVDKDGFTVYDLDSKRALVGKDHQGSLNTGKAILQMTSQNLKNRK